MLEPCEDYRLLAYPPIIITADNETSTTAIDDSNAPEWDSSETYGKNNLCQIDGKIYLSLEDTNTDRPISDPYGGDFTPTPKILSANIAAFDANFKQLIGYTAGYGLMISVLLTAGDLVVGVPSGTNGRAALNKAKYSKIYNASNIPLTFQEVNTVDLEYVGTLEHVVSTAFKVNSAYINYDPTLAYEQNELTWDATQITMFKCQYDLLVDAGRDYPLEQFFYPIDPSPKWVYITDVNPIRLYAPNPSQQTVGTSPLVLEWDITSMFTALNLFKLIGSSVRVEINTIEAVPVQLHDETYGLDADPEDYIEWLFDENPNLLDYLLIRGMDWAEAVTLKITITGDGEVGIGGMYPSNPISLGIMNYAPTISVINTVRTAKDKYLKGDYNTLDGRATDRLKYKTIANPTELDSIIRNLRAIARISEEDGYPTFFEGEGSYKSLQLLGYMPVYDQVLNSEVATTASLQITGAL